MLLSAQETSLSWTGNVERIIWLRGEVCVQCDQVFVSVEDHSGFGLDHIVFFFHLFLLIGG